MTNSIQKGKRGEREACKFFQEQGFAARRGQQYKGTPDSPDIIVEDDRLDGFHFEVKRNERFELYNSLDQAIKDAAGDFPVVIHRRNNKPWVAVMQLVDFLDILR